MKKILIFIVAMIIAGGATWYFFIRKPSAENPTGQNTTFFPTGEQVDPNRTIDGQIPVLTNNNGVSISRETLSQFKQLSSRAAAGFTFFTRQNTIRISSAESNQPPIEQSIVEHVIRYVSRATGYVYEIVDGSTPLQISNIYIPNIYEAYFADQYKTAILRFIRPDGKTIATYSVPIPDPNPDNTRTQLDGTFLPDKILAMSVSPDTKNLAILADEKGNGVVSTINSKGVGKKILISTPFREWLLSWQTANDIHLQTKASGTAEGFLYTIEKDQKLAKVLGNTTGLTTSVSPKGNYVLFSESTPTGFTAKILNVRTNNITNLNIAILPEKCVWLRDENIICAGNESIINGTYPDIWYQGLVSFSDKIYKIYTNTNTREELSDQTIFDMTNLQIDEEKGILYFINKTDGMLWQFKL